MRFSQTFKDCLKKDKITATSVARATGIPLATIYSYLNGKSVPGAENLARIANQLCVSMEFLALNVEDSGVVIRNKIIKEIALGLNELTETELEFFHQIIQPFLDSKLVANRRVQNAEKHVRI